MTQKKIPWGNELICIFQKWLPGDSVIPNAWNVGQFCLTFLSDCNYQLMTKWRKDLFYSNLA